MSVESKGHKGTLDCGAMMGFLVIQGLPGQRVKKASEATQDRVGSRGDQGQWAYRGHRVGLRSFCLGDIH